MKYIRKESSLRQKAMESEMSALRSQMNPHFIFNTLNSINSYIIDNKQEEASDYLIDFSRLIRIILEHSGKRTVTLQEELHALKLYLELEWRRLEGAFDYKINVHPDVDSNSVNIPPLIIQPYAENAIWHGLRGNTTDGHINIDISKHKEGILIVVEDNGAGRAASGRTEKVTNNHSFGTSATMKRILLNDPGSTIEIEDLYHADGQAAGTRVNIYLNQISK
jgi:LytS/YehU family sensor histidine kinase